MKIEDFRKKVKDTIEEQKPPFDNSKYLTPDEALKKFVPDTKSGREILEEYGDTCKESDMIFEKYCEMMKKNGFDKFNEKSITMGTSKITAYEHANLFRAKGNTDKKDLMQIQMALVLAAMMSNIKNMIESLCGKYDK